MEPTVILPKPLMCTTERVSGLHKVTQPIRDNPVLYLEEMLLDFRSSPSY